LLADAGKRSFRAFVKIVLGFPTEVRGNPLGFWWTESVHGALCDWLQEKVEEWEIAKARRYLLIDAHRGSGKTMIVTKAMIAWLLLRNPNLATVIDAVDDTQAIQFAEIVRNIFAGDDPYAIFTWLYGDWESPTWTHERFSVAPRRLNRTEGSVEVTSVQTGIVGRHPDVLVLDDPVTNDKLREQGNWVAIARRHVAGLYPCLLNHSLFVFVGTPYTDGDPLTSAIRRDGIKEVHGEPLPVDYAKYIRSTGLWSMYHLPGRKKDGTPTLPKAWPDHELTRYQAVNPTDYAAQIMLCPGGGDLQPITYAQIEECMINSAEVPRGLPVTLHFDTAFKSPKKMGTGDYSTIILAAHHRALADVYYLAEHGSNSWRDDDFVTRLIEIVRHLHEKKTHIICMTDERTNFGKAELWRDRLKSAFRDASIQMPRFLELNRGRGENNTVRVASVAGYWIDGHVKLIRGRCPNLVDQMARIGIAEHDDYASAAADAFHPEVYRVFNPGAGKEAPVPHRSYESILMGHDIGKSYDAWHRLKRNVARPPIR
jgi:hypothetical protein